ncbi:MAG: acylphosphatase [Paracoccaceae bacterium]
MTGAEAPIAVAVRVTGRVQGVWFRGWAREQARRLGLTGWVRNQPDGSVAALFVGQGTAVAEMLALCHQGPPPARVLGVETTPVSPAPELAEFRVER